MKEEGPPALDLDLSVDSTGCGELNEEVLVCMSKHRDWRKCQAEVQAFKQCFEDFQLLKLYYYTEQVTPEQFQDMAQAREYGGKKSRVGEQNPYEDPQFKVQPTYANKDD